MTAHGRLKFGGFTKTKLARVCGSDAKAKKLFLEGATRVDPTLLGVSAAAPVMLLVGTTFQGAVPVVEPGASISMITAKWLVSAGSAAGKYKLAAKVSGRQVASELEAISVQSMVAAAAAAMHQDILDVWRVARGMGGHGALSVRVVRTGNLACCPPRVSCIPGADGSPRDFVLCQRAGC